MKLVVIVLNKPECLEDVLTAFLEIGIKGATVINSVGMGRILSHDVPIFAGLRSAFPGSSPGNRTVLVLAEDTQVGWILEVVEDVCGDFREAGSGTAFVLAVESALGFNSGG